MRIKRHGDVLRQPRRNFKLRCFCDYCGCDFVAKLKDWESVVPKIYIDGCGFSADTITKYEVTTSCPECKKNVQVCSMSEELAFIAYLMANPDKVHKLKEKLENDNSTVSEGKE